MQDAVSSVQMIVHCLGQYIMMAKSTFIYYAEKGEHMAPAVIAMTAVLSAIVLPGIFQNAKQKSEKKRQALNIAKEFTTDRNILNIFKRLYLFRRYCDENETFTPLEKTYPSGCPYTDQNKMMFDSVIALNYLDTICVEIKQGFVDERLICEVLAPVIVGAHDIILNRLQAINSDYSKSFPILRVYVSKFRKYHDKKRKPLNITIKNPSQPPPSTNNTASQ